MSEINFDAHKLIFRFWCQRVSRSVIVAKCHIHFQVTLCLIDLLQNRRLLPSKFINLARIGRPGHLSLIPVNLLGHHDLFSQIVVHFGQFHNFVVYLDAQLQMVPLEELDVADLISAKFET